MKPYEKLTARGQILRLRKLCIKAQEDYPKRLQSSRRF